MAATLETTIRLVLQAILTGDVPDNGSAPSSSISLDQTLTYHTGVATQQANRVGSDNNTLATATAADLNLTTGFVDPITKVAIPFLKIKAIILVNPAANTTNLTIKPGAANGFVGPFGAATHTLTVKPGNFIVLTDSAGWPVVASTGDLINLANSAGATAAYSLYLIGTDA